MPKSSVLKLAYHLALSQLKHFSTAACAKPLIKRPVISLLAIKRFEK
jgi:hypothetical protein